MALYFPDVFPIAEVNEALKRKIHYVIAEQIDELSKNDPKALEKMLREEGGQWCVYSSDGSQKLGCHPNRKDAIAQLVAVESSKLAKQCEDSILTKAEEDIIVAELEKGKKAGDVTSGGEFVGGFEGCVQHMMDSKGLPEENARKLCAFIGRKAGKIKSDVKKSEFHILKNENGEASWELDFEFQKLSDEEHLVGGIVYEPDMVDAQGDSASPAEILKAAHKFMLESSTLGIMHKEKAGHRAQIVETYLAPVTFKMGDQIVRKGSWIMIVKVHDEELWAKVKKGEITGFSMSGRARNGGPATVPAPALAA